MNATKILVLPVEMFDDGSMECFNFWLAYADDSIQCNLSQLIALGLRERIQARMDLGEGWLDCKGLNIVVDGQLVLEVQWS